MNVSATLLAGVLCVSTAMLGRAAEQPPFKVVVAGLVHGHASGFFEHNQRRPDLEIVGVVEPSRELFDQYAKKFQSG